MGTVKISPKRISELTLASTLTGAEVIALVQAAETRQVTVDTIKDYTDTSCQCTIVSRSDQVCTDANTLEKFLQTYTLEGGTLANDGEWLDIFASFSVADNANTKTITFYFGGTSHAMAFATTASPNDYDRSIHVKIQRKSNTTQKGFIYLNPTGTLGGIINPTETLSADIQISFSGTNGTASANDICIEQFIIVHHRLDVTT